MPMMGDLQVIYIPTGYDEKWVVVLNKYQRDNLLWLLQAMGYGPKEAMVEPFHLANNGDWVGEIALMLGTPAKDEYGRVLRLDYAPERPNSKPDSLRAFVDSWLKQRAEAKP